MRHWTEDYVGIPFAEDGHSGGLHCWSLCRRVLMERVGIEVPSYGEISARDLGAVAGFMADRVDTWVQVPSEWANDFDIVLMGGRLRGRPGVAPVHAGIMVGHYHVLHVEESTATALVPIDHTTVKFRILGFYRHRSLCDASGMFQ